MSAGETRHWRAAGGELSALVATAVSMPLRLVLRNGPFDPAAPHPTPVVLVHGLLGDATNFLALRRVLSARGILNVSSFSYLPRIDVSRLARRLAHTLESVCEASGAARVDVVGHSLGGLIARYLVETGEGRLVRRLVTLGAPVLTSCVAERELAIFGTHDPLVPPPDPAHGPRGRTRVVPGCGHLGLLYHPEALRAVARYLARPAHLAAAPVRQRATG